MSKSVLATLGLHCSKQVQVIRLQNYQTLNLNLRSTLFSSLALFPRVSAVGPRVKLDVLGAQGS